jgi:CRISPR-associated endonuclease/helicase Cas3
MKRPIDFSTWFSSVTQRDLSTAAPLPFPYQERFATISEIPIILNVPTGAGKTATIILGWLWRRHYAVSAIQATTPRRLIYCLPMRTLVEQTFLEVEFWLGQAGLRQNVELHLLMGGAVSNWWDAFPEKDCIIIGTQDQLLSRALNRGYGMSRYKWSIHFALLNNDCLWCMDEVQLMGAGFKTTAQLQGFREHFHTYGVAQSLWMSATLDSNLLHTVDYQPDLTCTHSLTDADLAHPVIQQRMKAKKALFKAEITFGGKDSDYAKALAQEVIAAHVPGSLSIVICNRVNRAQALYQTLKKQTAESLLLVHSRFRADERRTLNERLRDRNLSGILVATQAIEAGVDISAKVMFTELAPWSSLVQRFGRCNRYGECSEDAKVYWIDSADLQKKGSASPYEAEELDEARSLLQSLVHPDVGTESLAQVKAKTQKVEGLLPRKHDLLQLFDTSTDLAGHDIDVSSFIRESEENDVAIAWRTWEEKQPSNKPCSDMGALRQDELCRVSLYNARTFLEELKKRKRRAWVWDRLKGEWVDVQPVAIYPGMNLLLHCSDGGYSSDLGFTGNVIDKNFTDVRGKEIKQDQNDADLLTNIGQFMTLKQHSEDVSNEVQKLCEYFPAYELPIPLLERAGRWHDLGKAHPDFQEMMTRDRPDRQNNELWAKSDHSARIKTERRGFRHELVSALVALQQGEPFLLSYLVAAHHGKVRMMIQPHPKEKRPDSGKPYALGVWEGDRVPGEPLESVELGDDLSIPAQEISLACMEFGGGTQGESWTAQAIALLEEYGPFRLAFLETLIRVGDWRASAMGETKDA